MQKQRSVLWVTIFLMVLTVFVLASVPYVNSDFPVLATFLINGFIFSVGILVQLKNYPFSLNLIFWTFMYFFMFFAPFIQYTSNKYPWGESLIPPTDNEVFLCNLIIFFFSILWILGKVLFKSRQQKKKIKQTWISKAITIEYKPNYNKKYPILLFLSILITLIALYNGGISGIFDSQVRKFYSGENHSFNLILNISLPAVLTFVFIFYFSVWRDTRKHLIPTIISLACLIISYFPTTISRYMTAAIYLGILMVVLPAIRKRNLFFVVFVFGLFIMFPFLNLFRYGVEDISIPSFLNNLSENFISSYTEGHYDAYISLVSALRYVTENSCVWGRQLIGAVLFFVPRTIWPNKPIGSGAMLMDYFSPGSFSNVSCTFIAEWLLNFGMVGILLAPIVFGYFFSKFDYNYHYYEKISNKGGITPYVFLVPLVFFLLRGDMMSGFAYTFGFIFIGVIIKYFTIATKSKGSWKLKVNNLYHERINSVNSKVYIE